MNKAFLMQNSYNRNTSMIDEVSMTIYCKHIQKIPQKIWMEKCHLSSNILQLKTLIITLLLALAMFQGQAF